MYSLTMARAHPYRGFFWQSVLISVVALAHHHSHSASAGIQTMVCLHGTIPRAVSLSLYQCALPTTLAGLVAVVMALLT
jgi:hypothetical protein